MQFVVPVKDIMPLTKEEREEILSRAKDEVSIYSINSMCCVASEGRGSDVYGFMHTCDPSCVYGGE